MVAGVRWRTSGVPLRRYFEENVLPHSFLDVCWVDFLMQANHIFGVVLDSDHVFGILLLRIDDLCAACHCEWVFLTVEYRSGYLR